MITKVIRGKEAYGLVRYLFVEGCAEGHPQLQSDHTDPHLVAVSDGDIESLEPAHALDGEGRSYRQVGDLSARLERALDFNGVDRKKNPIYHVAVRCAPGDRRLSDEEWADVAAEMMDRTGIAKRGDAGGCRWIAVRHADDHIHIVATLARRDGRAAKVFRDYLQLGEVAREMEAKYGLQMTAARDRTANPRLTRAEEEKAKRLSWTEPPRTFLRRQVRTAAAAARGPEEFFDKLRDAGLIVKPRLSEKNPGEITGYAVASSQHADKLGTHIFYSGGKLGSDLTLPKLAARWDVAPVEGKPATKPPAAEESPEATAGNRLRLTSEERERIWQRAVDAAAAAARDISSHAAADPGRAADSAWAAADFLSAAAQVVDGDRRRGPLRVAAEEYERAAREIGGKVPPPSKAGNGLRAAGRLLAAAQVMRSSETAQLLALLAQLEALADSVMRMRENQDRAAQAAAAKRTAELLREGAHGYAPLAGTAGARKTASTTWAEDLDAYSTEDPTRRQGRGRS